ncbi:MAG TPA: prenyltransferase [Mycobacteriales bacterium]|nr:prenyltransferase [Mycobacteriales bacterium]
MSRPDIPSVAGVLTAEQVRTTGASIAGMQEPSGAIPWFPGGHCDPWDHIECAMALLVTGFRTEAEAAYEFLLRWQRPDGSWPSKITGGEVEDPTFETNQCAYVAVGTWHHWLITRDREFLHRMWPSVRRALDLVTSYATDRGEIAWSVTPEGEPRDGGPLLTGSSSTYHSLRCGLALADLVDQPQPEWEIAAGRLGHLVSEHPEVFVEKDRFSMDWYYPVLGGAVRGEPARRRFRNGWDRYVVPGLGIRCVDDEPWVTGAESAECVIALETVGMTDRALQLFGDIQHLREADGSYWTGWQYAASVNWPDEHSSWTAAAVVLAADTLSSTTAASDIFRADALPLGTRLGGGACGCEPSEAGAVRR